MEIRKELFPHFSRDFIIKLILIGTTKKNWNGMLDAKAKVTKLFSWEEVLYIFVSEK